MFYNVIRWPGAQGEWWFVGEKTTTSGYTPLMPLYPKKVNGSYPPTWENQLWTAAELLVNKGLEALNNPHAMTGRTCGCGDCFCCAALEVYKIARDAAQEGAQ